MIRRIIRINEEACTGCGACAAACHEGAIIMIDGKAKLTREDYCDGLGDCLPACPAGAITFEEREAPAYDEAAVRAAKAKKAASEEAHSCPGSRTRIMEREERSKSDAVIQSQLTQWPVQIKLVQENAPYFAGADLLIAADCTAYAYGDFHNAFMRGRITLIGCPKLDATDYSEKLAQILSGSQIKSITIVRMEVPCCGGMEQAVKRAMQVSGKSIPCSVVIISADGKKLKG
ncbi:MAG: 4Fe-4S binding protein [Oscillospiraceae bacterium]|nr:4Fe-4S binding protein [Oscillospiraceae bacterium]